MSWLIGILVLTGLALAIAVNYSIVFPRQPFAGPLPALTASDRALAASLKRHVVAVASEPHNLDYYPALEAAATYIERTLRETGYEPSLQIYEVRGRPVRNIEVVFEPANATRETPTIILGAHYDSPDDSPGANDNGTGVAAALEVARSLFGFTPRTHRLRLVFWVNEEAPYGHTPDMGSWQHAKRLSDAGERVTGMFALETLGYFSDEPGTQKFPQPFGLVYPDTGNFVAFVGLPGSRSFLRKSLAAFREETAFPSIGGVAPGFLEGIANSDHWAYHQFGFPALMITDTAPFRNPYYHQLDDTPDNVDYESLARITAGIERMLREIC
jgi:Zn-dependent M28 family amino/carboxypeptidase